MELYPPDKPSMDNIYKSNYWETVKQDQYKKGEDMYLKSKNPFKTGVVPLPATSSMFQPISENNETISSLTGEKINIEKFKHNNMQPFLKGNVTQNTDLEKFTQKLDNDTGNDKYYQSKKEVHNFFKPTTGYDNINGMKSNTDYYKERIELPRINNNVFPIQQINVAPGLNKGYTNIGSGGFQHSDTNEYAKPRSLEEIRTKSNQKETYFEIPFQSPPKGVEQRGIVTSYSKNKPERTYKQTEDNWFKTTGSIVKERERPIQVVKTTYKPDLHTEYTGGAKMENIKGVGKEDDYGKNNIIVYDNERNETQTRTVVSNITTNVKSMITPLYDIVKNTIKEYTIDAPRLGGNPRAQIPEKATTYDPVNHILKTTVKETTLQEDSLMNLTGADKSYYPNDDIAKTTVKETLIHENDNINLTTNTASYVKNDDKIKTTIRETISPEDYTRNIGNTKYTVYVYDPKEIKLKTTVKETVVNNSKSEYGFLGGLLNGMLGGYLSKEIQVKNTNKQFMTDNEEYGIAGATNEYRQASRDADYNTEIDGAKEALLLEAGEYVANPQKGNIPIDKDDITMHTDKLNTDSISYRKLGNVNHVYQNTPFISIDKDEITKEPEQVNAYKDRLSGNILQSLKNNKFNIGINPIISS